MSTIIIIKVWFYPFGLAKEKMMIIPGLGEDSSGSKNLYAWK